MIFIFLKSAIGNGNLQITINARWKYLKIQMLNVLLHSATSDPTHFQIHHEIYIHMEIGPYFIQRKQFIHQKNSVVYWLLVNMQPSQMGQYY